MFFWWFPSNVLLKKLSQWNVIVTIHHGFAGSRVTTLTPERLHADRTCQDGHLQEKALTFQPTPLGEFVLLTREPSMRSLEERYWFINDIPHMSVSQYIVDALRFNLRLHKSKDCIYFMSPHVMAIQISACLSVKNHDWKIQILSFWFYMFVSQISWGHFTLHYWLALMYSTNCKLFALKACIWFDLKKREHA